MGIFAIDIDRLHLEYLSAGKELKGLFCLQYPVYCIHTTIEDSSVDSLDSFDQLIIDLIIANPSLNAMQIASIIGCSKKLIQLRLTSLSTDGLIICSNDEISITENGIKVFQEKELQRIHIRSYDFLLDGITLNPLPEIFYSFYRSKLISENDCNYITKKDGTTYTVKPFGPDIVHSPPEKDRIIEKIFSLTIEERESYAIPPGLLKIKEVSFSRLSFPVLIAALHDNEKVYREPVDGFISYSLKDNTPFLEAIVNRILPFVINFDRKIANLSFKLSLIPSKNNPQEYFPKISSNWSDIDRYPDNQNVIFSFSSEDLVLALKSVYDINMLSDTDIINTDFNVGLSISKEVLLQCNKKQKLVSDLIRGRNYEFCNINDNVFLIFYTFISNDPFVNEVIRLRQLIKENFHADKFLSIIKEFIPEQGYSLRELLNAAGEFDILEKLDIAEFMIDLNSYHGTSN